MSLTKSDLTAIKKIVGDEIHEKLSEHHAEMVMPEFEKIDKRFDKLENRVGSLETKVGSLETKVDNNHRWLKDEINGLKGEFSLTVSRKEFNRLKTKVDRNLLPQ